MHLGPCRAICPESPPEKYLRRQVDEALGLAGPCAVAATRPAAGPSLALFELLLSTTDATLSSRLLLGVLYPADELVARQRGDVRPEIEGSAVRGERLTQVGRQLMDDPAGHPLATHVTTVTTDTSPEATPAFCRRGAIASLCRWKKDKIRRFIAALFAVR